MNAAMLLVDAYESKYGGLFIDMWDNSFRFPAEDSNDGYTLQRIMLVVQQAILDQVYHGSPSDTQPEERIHDSNIENCKDYLRGRYWKTCEFFPGYVELPVEQSTTVHSVKFDATVKESWGTPECYSDSPVIHATGLYLPPGGVAWVTFPSALVGKSFIVQVGAHDANLDFKDNKHRMDRITTTYHIKDQTTYIASPLGGGVYIKVPYLADYGTRTITVSGDVIKAPFFCKFCHSTRT